MTETNAILLEALHTAKDARAVYGELNRTADCERANSALYALDLDALIAALQPPVLKLFYIQYGDEENNYDLFVWAESAEQAKPHFIAYYDLDMEDVTVMGDMKLKIREIPVAAPDKAGAISWTVLNATLSE